MGLFPMYNIEKIRHSFKALDQKVQNNPLVYLDSAATTLKPVEVVDRIQKFYLYESANVHRGAHFLSDQATQHFESARESIKDFLGAESAQEIIFTQGTTGGINLIADTYGRHLLQEGDEIVLTEMEHHSNIVPWQNLAQEKNLKLSYIPVLENGNLDLSSLDQIITSKTKLVSFTGCSNILGTINPIEKIVEQAKKVKAVTVLDAAQLVTQKKIDVKKWGIDFLVFSSHKLFGPYGFGALFGRKELLEKMPPYQFGGSMISSVKYEKSSYNSLPYKFEAGTPHIEGAIGTAAAIQFFNQFSIDEIFQHEKNLAEAFINHLKQIPEAKIFGESETKAAIVSFNLKGAHHSDIGQILDQQGVAVRVGHHCTQPLLAKFGLTGTVRASFSIYNNMNDVERLILALDKARKMLL